MTETEADAWEFFEILAMLGPATFLEPLIPPNEAAKQFLRYSETDSRNFLLLRILIEVQKCGTAMGRWRKYAAGADLDRSREELGTYDRQTLEAYVDEQSLWQRKLSEGLVLLINFTATNDLPYYYHFLLVQELEQLRRRVHELSDFFDITSTAAERKRAEIESKLEATEHVIGNLSTCWYLDQRKLRRRRQASFSRQLEFALRRAGAAERRAFGYTYAKGFGEASGNIHFNSLKPEQTRPYRQFSVGFAFCGLLTVGILDRAHQVAGALPEGINRRVATVMAQKTERDPTTNVARVGDFVLVEGPRLGVVEESVSGQHGYEAYRVRDVEKTGEDGDWFPAFDVMRFVGKQELADGLETTLADFCAQGLPPLEPPPTDDEIDQAIGHAMLEIWQKGVGEYVRRAAQPRVMEPRDES